MPNSQSSEVEVLSVTDIRLAHAWLGERNSKADRYRVRESELPLKLQGGPQPRRVLGRSTLGVWAQLRQDGGHRGQTGGSALLGRLWLIPRGYCCVNRSRDPIGQKPPLVLFLKLFG